MAQSPFGLPTASPVQSGQRLAQAVTPAVGRRRRRRL